MKNNSSRLIHSLLLLLTAAIWGTAFVAQSVAMDYIGPFTFNGTRSLIGAIVLLPVVYFFDRDHKGIREDNTLIGGITCGILLFLASNFQQFGITMTTVGKTGFITACYIIIVPILGLFLHKKCSYLVWIAVVLTLVGLYLLCMKEGFSIGQGDILLIICAFLFAIHILVIDHYSMSASGVKMSCIQFFVCAVLSILMAFIFEEPSAASLFDAKISLLYAGIMSCGVGYTLQIIGQKDVNPTIASLILSLESCISALSGWLLLGQKLSFRELTGCVIMFAAIILAQLPAPDLSRLTTTQKKASD